MSDVMTSQRIVWGSGIAPAWRGLITAACLLLAGAGALRTATAGESGVAAKHRWTEYLPNIEVVAQTGQKLRFYDDAVKGKIVLFSFIYTSCLEICPLITARLAQVYDALGEAAGRDVHFISISIDPERDTPDRMKRHAGRTAAGDHAPGRKARTGPVHQGLRVVPRHRQG